jgi:hypothetical protein
MFPDFNFVDYVMVLLGFLLCFKRVAEMERYYGLRIIVLTSILGAVAVFLLFVFASALDDKYQYFGTTLDNAPSHRCENFSTAKQLKSQKLAKRATA